VVAWHNPTTDELVIQINDGTPATAAWSSGTLANVGTLFLGEATDNPSPTNPFSGLIDEVGFWKRVLTDAERTWLYNAGAGRSYADIYVESQPGAVAEDVPLGWAGQWPTVVATRRRR
jgi:hypothetical protein